MRKAIIGWHIEHKVHCKIMALKKARKCIEIAAFHQRLFLINYLFSYYVWVIRANSKNTNLKQNYIIKYLGWWSIGIKLMHFHDFPWLKCTSYKKKIRNLIIYGFFKRCFRCFCAKKQLLFGAFTKVQSMKL